MAKIPEVFAVYKTPINIGRKEVTGFMIADETKEGFRSLGKFFADLAKISDNFMLPETNEELVCLVRNIVKAKVTGDPITLYTPLCPDWSMDEAGRYDFKSLGGRESFIAKKFFTYSPEFLEVLAKNKIPYEGVLIFADWGMETEIMDNNTYGVKLAQDDIRSCFDSSYAAVDEHLGELQKGNLADLFRSFRTVLMTTFFEESGIDLDDNDRRFRKFFIDDRKGNKLLKRLGEQSYPVNNERMGLTHDKSDAETLENLVDYAIFGQALSPHGIILSCESRVTSIAYNLPKPGDNKVPMFFIKGVGKDSGVNIL